MYICIVYKCILYVYTYICMQEQLVKKEAMDLESGEEYMGGFGERKWKGEML